jgi:hypothetical protein
MVAATRALEQSAQGTLLDRHHIVARYSVTPPTLGRTPSILPPAESHDIAGNGLVTSIPPEVSRWLNLTESPRLVFEPKP